MTNKEFIVLHTGLPASSVLATIDLLKDNCTIPFIARYRKEKTNHLDEVQIQDIAVAMERYEKIVHRKQSIEKSIEEQGLLTPEVSQKLQVLWDEKSIEDFYLPFKRTKTTKAEKARKKGLEPLAKMMMAQNNSDMEKAAMKFLNKEVENIKDAIEGALHIVAEWINENVYIRNQIRKLIHRTGILVSKRNEKTEGDEQMIKLKDYFDFKEQVNKVAPHRFLAIHRGSKANLLKVSIDMEKEDAISLIEKVILKPNSTTKGYLSEAAKDAYQRLLFPALENEKLNELKLSADVASIDIFAKNLRQLLLMPPLGQKRILALDPGYRTGCKLVCLSETGELLHNETIYPNPPQNQKKEATNKLYSLINAYKIEAIAIGNGTASRETEGLIKNMRFDRDLQVFVVNEAGASIYSASKIAREEFPNYDVTVRGAVSIGRRLIDPLAELVKIDPKSIGVGQYQHDVSQTDLKKSLDQVVSSCVNHVGVDLNTASTALLQYVSGIGEKTAQNIVEYRDKNGPFKSRGDLLEVNGLGKKAFEQSAGFLRVPNAKNPLDNSAVHPESYSIVEKMAKNMGVSLSELIGNTELIQKIDKSSLVNSDLGLPTIEDILEELEKPGRDPRNKIKSFSFADVHSIDDLKLGMTLPGIVNNITQFGCFVDVGIKESGLVHISELKDGFVSDVNEVVTLNQMVNVKVIQIDKERKRIGLSMK